MEEPYAKEDVTDGRIYDECLAEVTAVALQGALEENGKGSVAFIDYSREVTVPGGHGCKTMSISASTFTTTLIVSLLTMSAISAPKWGVVVSMTWQHGHHQNAPD